MFKLFSFSVMTQVLFSFLARYGLWIVTSVCLCVMHAGTYV